MSLLNRLYLIGTCMVTNLKNAAKVQVKVLELDEFLHMYFPKRRTLYAYDREGICRPGDVVLIKKLEKHLTKEITHEISEIVYPLGNIIDPITNKKVLQMEFEDDMNKRYKAIGGGNESYEQFLKKMSEEK